MVNSWLSTFWRGGQPATERCLGSRQEPARALNSAPAVRATSGCLSGAIASCTRSTTVHPPVRGACSIRWSVSRLVAAPRTTRSRPTEVLLVWHENAWDDYRWWQAQDRKVLKRINALLVDIKGNGNEGILQTRGAQTRLRRIPVQANHRRASPCLQDRRQGGAHRSLPLSLRVTLLCAVRAG